MMTQGIDGFQNEGEGYSGYAPPGQEPWSLLGDGTGNPPSSGNASNDRDAESSADQTPLSGSDLPSEASAGSPQLTAENELPHGEKDSSEERYKTGGFVNASFQEDSDDVGIRTRERGERGNQERGEKGNQERGKKGNQERGKKGNRERGEKEEGQGSEREVGSKEEGEGSGEGKEDEREDGTDESAESDSAAGIDDIAMATHASFSQIDPQSLDPVLQPHQYPGVLTTPPELIHPKLPDPEELFRASITGAPQVRMVPPDAMTSPSSLMPEQRGASGVRSRSIPPQLLIEDGKWMCPGCGNQPEIRYMFCTECGHKRDL